MPSFNKIIGHVYDQYINLEIYISSKTLTQGLCGLFDGNKSNDIFNRFTGKVDAGAVTYLHWGSRQSA